MGRVFCLLAGVLVAGCQTAPPSDVPPGPIMTLDALSGAVIGRTLTTDDLTLVINRNGSLSGIAGGEPFRGSWSFEDGALCRRLTDNPTAQPDEDCQMLTLNPDGSIDVVRGDGSGGTLQVR